MIAGYPRINLVGDRLVLRTQEKLQKKKITSVSVIVTGIYLLLFGAVVGVHYFYTQKITSIDVEISQMSSQISSLKNTESKYKLVSKKLSVLSNLLTERVPLQPIMVRIVDLIPAGVTIDSILLGDSSKILTVSVKASDVFVVETLLAALDTAIEVDFSKIVVLSTKRTDDGTYLLLLEFYFNESTS